MATSTQEMQELKEKLRAKYITNKVDINYGDRRAKEAPGNIQSSIRYAEQEHAGTSRDAASENGNGGYENAGGRRSNENSGSYHESGRRVSRPDGYPDRQTGSIGGWVNDPAGGSQANTTAATTSTGVTGLTTALPAPKKVGPTSILKKFFPGARLQDATSPTSPTVPGVSAPAAPTKKPAPDPVKPYTEKETQEKLQDLADIYEAVFNGVDIVIQAVTTGHELEEIWGLTDDEAKKLAGIQLKKAKRSKKAAGFTSKVLEQHENITAIGLIGSRVLATGRVIKEKGITLR